MQDQPASTVLNHKFCIEMPEGRMKNDIKWLDGLCFWSSPSIIFIVLPDTGVHMRITQEHNEGKARITKVQTNQLTSLDRVLLRKKIVAQVAKGVRKWVLNN
jgi:hypothetical protein